MIHKVIDFILRMLPANTVTKSDDAHHTPSAVAYAIVDAFSKRRKDFTFSVNNGEFRKINKASVETFLYNTKHNSVNTISVVDTKTGEVFKFSAAMGRFSSVCDGGGFDGLDEDDIGFVVKECEGIIWDRLKQGAKRLGGKAVREASDVMTRQMEYERRKRSVYKHLEEVYCK